MIRAAVSGAVRLPEVPRAARIRHELRRLIAVRDTGRDIDGFRLDLNPDEVVDGINVAERMLRPRAVPA